LAPISASVCSPLIASNATRALSSAVRYGSVADRLAYVQKA
jgi:hypothetical protein